MPSRNQNHSRDLAPGRLARRTKVLLLVAACFATSSMASTFHLRPAELTPAQQEVWNATVSLEVWPWRHGTRAGGKERGSGLVVATDRVRNRIWIATAAHAVACENGCSLKVRFHGPERVQEPGSVDSLPERQARVLWRQRGADLALLEVRWPASLELPGSISSPRAGLQGRPGERVVAMGFPDLGPVDEPARAKAGVPSNKVFSIGRLESLEETFDASLRAYGSDAGSGRLRAGRAWTHTAAILPGSSGGPLVSATGEVLGLNVGSLATSGGACVSSTATEPATPAPCLHLAVDLDPLWQELLRRGLVSTFAGELSYRGP